MHEYDPVAEMRKCLNSDVLTVAEGVMRWHLSLEEEIGGAQNVYWMFRGERVTFAVHFRPDQNVSDAFVIIARLRERGWNVHAGFPSGRVRPVRVLLQRCGAGDDVIEINASDMDFCRALCRAAAQVPAEEMKLQEYWDSLDEHFRDTRVADDCATGVDF